VTPYAVLLVKPTDDDLTIRKRFHELSWILHPDRNYGTPGASWQAVIDAYQQVKTQERRTDWCSTQGQLARMCIGCQGYGVTWRRVGKDKSAAICSACGGEGRRMKK
jgi:DnaJ-class molecular chaperone